MSENSNLRAENEVLRRQIAALEMQLAGSASAQQTLSADACADHGVQLHALFSTMAQGVVYQDAAGIIVLANPAAEEILGLSIDELVGRTSVDPRWHAIHEDGSAFPGQDHPAMVALRTGKPVNDIVMGVFHPREAAYRWILVSATPEFRADERRPYQVFTTFNDITARKVAEENLREREMHHRALVESLNISLCRWLPDTTLVYANDVYCNTFGIHGEPIGRKWVDFLPDDARKEIIGVYRQLADAPRVLTHEYPVTGSDGRLRQFQWIHTPIFGDNGRLVEFQSVGIDITDRKLIELKLRESEAGAQAMLRAIPDMMFRLDRHGVFLEYKAEKNSLYDQYAPSLIGLHGRESLPPGLGDLLDRKIALTLATGEQQTFEFYVEIPEAGRRDLEVRMSAIDGDQVIALVRDITERKQTEQKLRESEARFRSFFETSAAVMFIIEPDSGAIMDANQAASNFYGYSREQLRRMNINDINQLPPDEVLRERLRAKHEERNYFIFPHRLANGEVRTVEVRSHPIQTDGKVLLFSLVYDITERRQVEARLGLEQLKFSQIAATVPGLIFSFRQTPDGAASMPYAGPMIREVLGLDPADVANDTTVIFSRTHPDDLGGVLESIAQSTRTMAPWYSENRYNHPTKGWIWLEGRSMPTRQEDGSLVWHGFITDITERKQSEQLVYVQRDLARAIGSVATMEAGLKLCFETALRISGLESGGIYLFDRNRTVLELVYHQGLSPAFVQETASLAFDSPVAQSIMSGAFTYQLVDESNPSEVYRREGLKTIGVAPIVYQDSVIGCLNLAARTAVRVSDFVRYALETLASEIGNFIVYLRAELSRRESEERYRTLANELEQRVRERTAEVQDLYDNAPTGYHSLDAEGRLVMINQTEAGWLGYTREELIGRRFADFFTPDSLKAFNANFPVFIRRGWVRDIEFELVRRDGTTFPVLVSATAITDDAGNYLMSRTTVFDNTERKMAEVVLRNSEAQLRKSRDQLSAANAALDRAARMKDEFLANMSHELRTPLTGILGLSEALQMLNYGELNERQLRALRSIETSGRHLLDLINDILDLSKIESGMLELEVERVELSAVCRAALQLTRGMAEKKGHYVRYSMRPPALTVRCDARRLKQMLVNLLSNAIKFTPAGRELGLDVQADPVAESVSLTVWDRGIGITPADVERLFQPFVQLESSLARQYEGSGLGLPLVRSMAELHGGSVHIESQLGEGSRFTIVLPWRPHDADLSEQADGGAPTPKTALIVDDNEIDARRLAQFISILGFEATIQPLGQDIVARVAQEAPAVLLVCLNEPNASGLEILAALRQDERTHSIPVVVCSSMANRTLALEQGAAGYLTKPVQYVDLRDEFDRLAIGSARPSTPVSLREAVHKVMLVDDNELIIEVLTTFLDTQGYDVVAARSGMELLEVAPDVHPDIILMDIQMPGMNGLDATRRVRAHPDATLAKVPIIALTALAMTGDRERCLAAGANDYLSKPVSLVELAALIRTYLQ